MALLAAINPAELNVKVIGAERAKEGHSEYIVLVESAGESDGTPRLVSQTRRRYNDFLRLHEDVFHLVGRDFPAPKTLFTTEAVVRERTYQLGKYLKQLLALVAKGATVPIALMRFLDLPSAPREVTGALAQLSDGEMMKTAVSTFSAATISPYNRSCASHGFHEGGEPYSPVRSSVRP